MRILERVQPFLHLSIIEIFYLLVMCTLSSGNSGSSYEKMQLLGDVLKINPKKPRLFSHITKLKNQNQPKHLKIQMR